MCLRGLGAPKGTHRDVECLTALSLRQERLGLCSKFPRFGKQLLGGSSPLRLLPALRFLAQLLLAGEFTLPALAFLPDCLIPRFPAGLDKLPYQRQCFGVFAQPLLGLRKQCALHQGVGVFPKPAPLFGSCEQAAFQSQVFTFILEPLAKLRPFANERLMGDLNEILFG